MNSKNCWECLLPLLPHLRRLYFRLFRSHLLQAPPPWLTRTWQLLHLSWLYRLQPWKKENVGEVSSLHNWSAHNDKERNIVPVAAQLFVGGGRPTSVSEGNHRERNANNDSKHILFSKEWVAALLVIFCDCRPEKPNV